MLEVIEGFSSEKTIRADPDSLSVAARIYRRMWLMFYWFRCIAFICFIGFRILEDVILNFYVDFQNQIKLEELEVNRSIYVRIESRIQ